MMMFLLLLIFGFIHMAMLATTKLLVNFAAFSAARTQMVGGSAFAGAASALFYLRWSPTVPPWMGTRQDSRFFRGKSRQGLLLVYHVPFGLPIYQRLGPLGTQIRAFAPFTPQPSIPEDGDNGGG
jgi:hypothetical protein